MRITSASAFPDVTSVPANSEEPASPGRPRFVATGSGVHASHGGSGYSAHGDFVNAWLPGTLEERVERCLRRAVKCATDGAPS